MHIDLPILIFMSLVVVGMGGGMGGMGMPPPEEEDEYGDDGHAAGPGGNMEF